MKKYYLICFFCYSILLLSFSNIYKVETIVSSNVYEKDIKIVRFKEPKDLQIFKNAYPQITFDCSYDESQEDWKILVTFEDRSEELYWADGKFLPLAELPNKDLYSSFLYNYAKTIPNPESFTEEDIANIKNFSNPKNRREGKGTPQFLYNIIYDVKDRITTESHIKSHSFLGKKTNAHEYIHGKLDLVQADIYAAAKEDAEVQSFLDKLLSADSYAWRSISDSGNRSFHSMGLAIDLLPKGWQQKNLYWAWRRDIDKDNWMMLPLDRRWMPPMKVVEIFEKHGFIWGGKWIIWDNMHFEYRPEVILHNKGI